MFQECWLSQGASETNLYLYAALVSCRLSGPVRALIDRVSNRIAPVEVYPHDLDLAQRNGAAGSTPRFLLPSRQMIGPTSH